MLKSRGWVLRIRERLLVTPCLVHLCLCHDTLALQSRKHSYDPILAVLRDGGTAGGTRRRLVFSCFTNFDVLFGGKRLLKDVGTFEEWRVQDIFVLVRLVFHVFSVSYQFVANQYSYTSEVKDLWPGTNASNQQVDNNFLTFDLIYVASLAFFGHHQRPLIWLVGSLSLHDQYKPRILISLLLCRRRRLLHCFPWTFQVSHPHLPVYRGRS